MSKPNAYVIGLAALGVVGSAIFAASQNFLPDFVFKGSALTGWHKLGQADWRAENGEIVGVPKESGRRPGSLDQWTRRRHRHHR